MKYVFLLFVIFELFLMILMLLMSFEGDLARNSGVPYSLTMLMASVAAIGLWKRKLWGFVVCALSIVICFILEKFFIGSGKIFLVHIGLLSVGVFNKYYKSLIE